MLSGQVDWNCKEQVLQGLSLSQISPITISGRSSFSNCLLSVAFNCLDIVALKKVLIHIIWIWFLCNVRAINPNFASNAQTF